MATHRTEAGRSTEPGLNPAQRRAAEIHEGPVLVIAGAGTGKTHTLVHRLVRLVEEGVEPESILLLTFTRRASEQMIARAAKILGRAEAVSGGTFHSFANLMLRRYGRAIGLDPGFTILDQGDTFEILSGIRSDMKDADIDLPRRETIAAVISKAVNKQAPIEDIVSEEYPQFFDLVEHLEIVAGRYERYKNERGLVDFDNLLVLLARLLEESEDTRARVHERYRYVMVDEYQDTNVLQAQIAHGLAGPARNIMVVGDDAQSIYAFRGACHRNLFDFEAAFEDAALVKLEENYRSVQPVLDVANALMSQMAEAFRKRLTSYRGEGPLPRLVAAWDEAEQATYVASEIERLGDEGVPLGQIAVLFRASRHSFPLELELQNRGIPFVKYGGFKFMESAHIKDVLAHLRVVAHPSDDLSLSRTLLMREGIGKKRAQDILRAVEGQPVAAALKAAAGKGKGKSKFGNSLVELAGLLETLAELADDPAECLAEAIRGYEPILQTRFDDWPRRARDLETLADLTRRYRSLNAMLADLTLEPPTASRNGSLAGSSRGGGELVLSTMHSAKGLEWRAVFVIQAAEGYIPMLPGFFDEPDEEALDEERRLLYVAVTRAKDRLYVVWPRETARARYEGASLSRFIAAVPEAFFEHLEAGEHLT